MFHNDTRNVTEATRISKSRYYETLCKKKSRYDTFKNAQNSVENRNWQNHSILQKIKNKKNKKFRKRADPPCECQKREGGVWFALYIYKSLIISVLFATKTDVFRQKRQKWGFFVSVSFEYEISIHKRKSRKQKVKR